MPFSLEEITYDPDLGQAFTILRTNGQFGVGGWIPGPVQKINAFGVITVADSKTLNMVPEGDRTAGAQLVESHTQIYTTSENAGVVSDKIIWRGSEYRTMSLGKWIDFGYYAAIMVRTEGA